MRSSFPHRLSLTVLLLAATLLFQSVGWLLAWKGLQFGARFEAKQALFQKVNTTDGVGEDANTGNDGVGEDANTGNDGVGEDANIGNYGVGEDANIGNEGVGEDANTGNGDAKTGNEDAKTGNRDADVSQGTFHKDFIQKIKVGRKEIVLNGHLYDYRILSESSDSVCLALYHDKHEQALLSALGQVFKSGEDSKIPSSTPLALWLSKWLGSDFLLSEKSTVFFRLELRFQKQNFTTPSFSAQFAPSVFAPPPEFRV